MKRLYISIVLVVLGALFISGWGLDMIVADDSPTKKSPESMLYEKLIEGFHHELNLVAPSQLQAKSEKLSQQF